MKQSHDRIGIGQRDRVRRRGNALVLVAGALVLLVIVASAYISSTQGIRKTTTAQRSRVNVDAAAGVIADSIAKEISEAIFVREIDTSTMTHPSFGQTALYDRLLGGGGGFQNEYSQRFLEDRRLPLSNSGYFNEMGREPGRYEIDRNFAWNYAPYYTTPWTNWPDYGAAWHGYDDLQVIGGGGAALQGVGNPPGQPGTSDTRWLRDLEPLRASTAYLGSTGLSPQSNLDTFSHYGHLSNLARPGNDWRICRDIADVTGAWSPQHDSLLDWEILAAPSLGEPAPDGFHYFGGLLRDHHVPVEQWLPIAPASNNMGALHRDPYSGTTFFTTPEDFWGRWLRWFDYAGYAYAQDQAFAGNTSMVPPNFYDLGNLDGDTGDLFGSGTGGGEIWDGDDSLGGGQIGERPDDEFRRGTARWHVSRVLSDTDGDGFTDSFWFHVPGSGSEGTMQIVGVSVTDNAGRLNANAGTRFIRSDVDDGWASRTRGWTPADLALVGQNAEWTPGGGNDGWSDNAPWRMAPKTHETWNVGFLDTPTNSVGLYDIEENTSMPFSNFELVNYKSLGIDSPDIPPANQNEESEVHQIWDASYFRGDTMADFVSETGIEKNKWFPEQYPDPDDQKDIQRQVNRLFYWAHAGSHPLEPAMGFTPFTISDELELRMNEGNNQPWLMSRFERAVGPSQAGSGYFNHPLRAFSHRQEHAELVDRLSARQLFHDNRRKLTLFNASRNDLLPPWLWWENRGSRTTTSNMLHGQPLGPPMDLVGIVGPPDNTTSQWDQLDDAWDDAVSHPDTDSFGDLRGYMGLTKFYDHMRQKLDLREHERYIDVHGLFSATADYRHRTFSERLPYALYLALNSGDLSWPQSSISTPTSRNPFDDPQVSSDDAQSQNLTRYLAASYAANMLAWRDPDSEAPLYTQSSTDDTSVTARLRNVSDVGAIRPPVFHEEVGTSAQDLPIELEPGTATEPAFLGIEMQPFIMEAFVGHVVEPWKIPVDVDLAGGGASAWGWGTTPGTSSYLFIEHDPSSDVPVFEENPQESRQILMQPRHALKASSSIVVVQLANPYDRPLPLFDRDPRTGFLRRDMPLYKVRFFGKEIVIDDTLVTARQAVDPSAELPLYLPPATSEAPYTLVLYATGISDANENEKWLDFLDIQPSDHFYRPGYVLGSEPLPNELPHEFSLCRDLDGNGSQESCDPETYGDTDFLLEIHPGDLICQVPSGTWETDRYGYDDGGAASGDEIAIELVRTHRRDWDANGQYWDTHSTGPAPTFYDYEMDVIIDRSGMEGEDDFYDTVANSLRMERLPNLNEINPLPGAVDSLNPVGGFQMNFPNKPVCAEMQQRFSLDSRYSAISSHLDNTCSNTTPNMRAFQFDYSVPSGVATSDANARYCQWARYARAWGVDPAYPSVESRDPPGATLPLPYQTDDVPAPLEHMRRSAPRYVIGHAEVTRSKGRPIYHFAESSDPLTPDFLLEDKYAGMEQVPGVILDRGYVTLPGLPEIHLMNQDSREIIGTPRYMFDHAIANGEDISVRWGQVFDVATDPDGIIAYSTADKHWQQSPWMTRNYRLPYRYEFNTKDYFIYSSRKPTFFDMNSDELQGYAPFKDISGPAVPDEPLTYRPGFPDKGYYGYSGLDGAEELAPHGMQMLQKDGNFEQVGEVLNVWLWGHELEVPAGPPTSSLVIKTTRTFSEAMRNLSLSGDVEDDPGGIGSIGMPPPKGGEGDGTNPLPLLLVFESTHPYLNRLVMDPEQAVNHEGNGIGKPRGASAWPHDETWLGHLGHVEPDMPAASRVLDLFVCDGPGIWDITISGNTISDGVVDYEEQASYALGYEPAFGNARAFTGQGTPGLINVNTASIEAMRAMPHMYKMVHGTPDWSSQGSIIEGTGGQLFDPHPRVAIPEAISMYRNLQGTPLNNNVTLKTGHILGPEYIHRGQVEQGATVDVTSRSEQGIAGIGELFLLNQYALNDMTQDFGTHEASGTEVPFDAWRMDYAANDPFSRRAAPLLRRRGASSSGDWNGSAAYDMRVPNPTSQTTWEDGTQSFLMSMGAPLSTDVNGERFSAVANGSGFSWQLPYEFDTDPDIDYFDFHEIYRGGDGVSGDAEEANLLFSGISNMVTTRSDVFTVHFRIRTFKQNPETGLWDATDPEMIVDDSRYVMLVDRSEVDTPNDSPRILYMQKVAN